MRRAAAGILVLGILLAACGGGGPAVRPLRLAVTESGGDLGFTLEEPVRMVECVERDYRRAAGDPAALRPIWTARCTAGRDCRSAIRWADRTLETVGPPPQLAPSAPGTCYECALTGDGGKGYVRFRMEEDGTFQRCRPSAGTL